MPAKRRKLQKVEQQRGLLEKKQPRKAQGKKQQREDKFSKFFLFFLIFFFIRC